jgi:small subunit ribosomal protein S16
VAVKLRLKRMGKKKQPTYRVVASDSRSPRDGRFIEIIGTYEPRKDPSGIEVDQEKAVEWLMKGAKASDTVRKLLEHSGAWEQFKRQRPDKPKKAGRKRKERPAKKVAKKAHKAPAKVAKKVTKKVAAKPVAAEARTEVEQVAASKTPAAAAENEIVQPESLEQPAEGASEAAEDVTAENVSAAKDTAAEKG